MHAEIGVDIVGALIGTLRVVCLLPVVFISIETES